MKTIGIMLPTLSNGDAVGNDCMVEYKLLKENGYNCLLYAENREGKFEKLMCIPKALRESDVILYHHAIHWLNGEKLLEEYTAGLRVLRYHNITPSHFFSPYSSDLRDSVAMGREQTARLVKMSNLYLSDSKYNESELLADGAPKEKSTVIPPFHQGEDLNTVHGSIETIDKLLKRNKPIVLFVGRQAPNKGLHHFVRVAKSYLDFFGEKAYFVWVGGQEPKFQSYYSEIQSYILKNHLMGIVSLPGKIPFEALKSYYLSSSAFLVVSEHEGFCVPVIEAQTQGIPIVALNTSAVGETAGSNQLVFDKMDYEKFAVALEVVLTRKDYSRELIDHGRLNYQNRFSKEVLSTQFLHYIQGVLQR